MKTRAAFVLPCILSVSSSLSVAQEPSSEYASWETVNGIAGAGAAVDSDGDGIPNGIEFVIGGDPSGPGSDSNSLLPTITVDTEYLYFTFRRTNAAKGYDPLVEYSSSLGVWLAAEGGVDGVIIDEDAGSDPNLVTVGLPRALLSGSRLFARLRVEITP